MSNIPFKISARTAHLIGRGNIASPEGAVIELVKNSYDADADLCIVYLHTDKKGNQSLNVIDNGHGMDGQTIEDSWMVIGSSEKVANPRSDKKKRIKTGAKGIGRFALDRLGSYTQMITASENNFEGYVWNVKWEEFLMNKTLDKVYATLDKRPVNYTDEVKAVTATFKPLSTLATKNKFKHGTIHRITKLRDEWTDETSKKLFKNLEILIPPKESAPFRVFYFDSREIKNYGEVKGSYCDDYDYKLHAVVNKDLSIKLSIERRELDIDRIDSRVFKLKPPLVPQDMTQSPYDKKTLKKGTVHFNTTMEELWPGIYEHYDKAVIKNIGAFDFTFYFMKSSQRDIDDVKYSYRSVDYKKRDEWLERFSGIKIYRDNFRVRPYGEEGEGYDWLKLNARQATSRFGPGQKGGAGYRVSAHQVYGVINISRIQNPFLEDILNREGIYENETFLSFKDLLINLIHCFELDRHYIMRAIKFVIEQDETTEQAKEEADKQADEDLEKQAKSKKGKTESRSSRKSLTYAKAVKSFQKDLAEKNEEIRLMRSLGSIGMTIATFTHELNEVSNRLKSSTNKLDKFLGENFKEKDFQKVTGFKNPFILIENMHENTKRFSHWISFANDAVKKDRRKAESIKLSNYFKEFKERWSELLESRKTSLVIGDNMEHAILKKTYPIDLDSIFNNLFLNTSDAFLRKDSSAKREIKIDVTEEDEQLCIYYEDSGPGLLKDIKHPDRIFDAFFTTKKQEGVDVGIGLGMWIVKTTVNEYNGNIYILRARPNFKLKITFPSYSFK